MKIMPIIKTISAVALLSAGSDFLYRKWQEEPVDRYVFTQNVEQLVKSSKNPNMAEFVKSLEDNKEQIKKVLKISEEQYNTYRLIAIGLAKEETNCGLDYSCTVKKYFTTICDWFNGKKSLSKGITNFKIDDVSVSEANILKQLGVKDISNPSESAIATIVHLNTLSKKYPKYLQNIASHSDVTLTENEYIVALWKHLHLDPQDSNIEIRNVASKALKIIERDRNAANPAGYVKKVLIYTK